MTSNETRFTEADLAPSPEDQRAARKALAERIAATFAAIAAGVWAGGMIALGVCAAPFVFRLTPAPFSGEAMASAFARFDQIGIGATIVILGGEVVRTWAAGRRSRSVAARIRRALGIVAALGAVYGGLRLTPQIAELHRAGAVRDIGPEGTELSRIHRQAELLSKSQIAVALALVAFHVLTLRAGRPEDDDDDDEYAVAPLPPGPHA